MLVDRTGEPLTPERIRAVREAKNLTTKTCRETQVACWAWPNRRDPMPFHPTTGCCAYCGLQRGQHTPPKEPR